MLRLLRRLTSRQQRRSAQVFAANNTELECKWSQEKSATKPLAPSKDGDKLAAGGKITPLPAHPDLSTVVESIEPELHIFDIPDGILTAILVKATEGEDPSDTITLSLVCRRTRSALLRKATKAFIHSDQPAPLAHCLKLRQITLSHCRNLPWPQDISHPRCKHLTNITHLNIAAGSQLSVPEMSRISQLARLEVLNLGPDNRMTDAAVTVIARAHSLTHLVIAHCEAIIDRGVACLAALTNLRSLWVAHCPLVTDNALRPFGALIHLATLNLGGSSRFTGEGLAYLNRPSLQELHLPCSPSIRDHGIMHLRAFPSLKLLNLAFCRGVTAAGLTVIGTLPALESLVLRGSSIHFNDVGMLPNLPRLTLLDISSTMASEDWLEHVAAAPMLTHLNLSACAHVSDDVIHHLTPELSAVRLRHCHKVTNGGLASLVMLTNLVSIELCDCPSVTDRGLMYVAVLSTLETLNISSCRRITDAGLERLSALTGLRELVIDKCSVVGHGLAHLTGFTCLTRLSTRSCGVTDVAMMHVTKIRPLKELDLAGNNVSDYGLNHLTRIRLRKLDLSRCHRLTDTGLTRVAEITSLEQLHLSHGTFSDAGISHLTQLTRLTSLDLHKCMRLDEDGVVVDPPANDASRHPWVQLFAAVPLLALRLALHVP